MAEVLSASKFGNSRNLRLLSLKILNYVRTSIIILSYPGRSRDGYCPSAFTTKLSVKKRKARSTFLRKIKEKVIVMIRLGHVHKPPLVSISSFDIISPS